MTEKKERTSTLNYFCIARLFRTSNNSYKHFVKSADKKKSSRQSLLCEHMRDFFSPSRFSSQKEIIYLNREISVRWRGDLPHLNFLCPLILKWNSNYKWWLKICCPLFNKFQSILNYCCKSEKRFQFFKMLVFCAQ